MNDGNLKFWKKTAGIYGLIQEFSNRKLYKEIIRRCCEDIAPEAKVLEIACGTGQLSEKLAEHAPDYLATDFCREMVEKTKQRCPAVHCHIMDATAMDLGNEIFDVVLIGNALHIMPCPEKALKECCRVLKKGGLLIAPTFVYEGKVNAFRMKLTRIAGFKDYYHWTSSQLKDRLTQQGLSVIRMEVLEADPLPECYIVAVKA